jgi:TonB family protein
LTERLRKLLPTEEVLRPVTPRRSLRIWRYAVPVAVLVLAGSGVLLRPLYQIPVLVLPPPALSVSPNPPRTTEPQESHVSAPLPLLPPAPLEAPTTPPLHRQISRKVLPDVSQKARDTIHGTLEVRVRARVSSAGSVLDATLESPGPSRYFGKRALEAVKRWEFSPLAGGSQSLPEEWILRFDYTNAGTHVSGERATR